MPDPQPPKLEYHAFKPTRPRFSWGLYIAGLVAGLAFSFLYYAGLAKSPVGGTMLLVFGAIIIKIVVGIVLLFNPTWRSFGRGLLLSIPFALLLGVGAVVYICSGSKL